MKMHVLGIEVSQGVSKKSGQPYAIGKLHAALPLAPARGDANIARGSMGSQYDAEPAVLQKVSEMPMPFYAEVEMQDVMRFGERKQQVVSIVPAEHFATGGKKAA